MCGILCHKIVLKIVSFWGKIGATVGAGYLPQLLNAKFAWCLRINTMIEHFILLINFFRKFSFQKVLFDI